MASNQVSVAAGIAMVVAGGGLWGVASYAQVQRALTVAPARSAPLSPCPPCPSCPAEPARLAPLATPPLASASSAPSASAPASAAASASAALASSAVAPAGTVFRFEPGKVVFAKDEIPRLLAHCREQLKTPQVKLLVEGVGDEEGPKGLPLGRSRAVVARQLLIEAGFDGERLVLAPPRVSAEDAGLWLRPLEVKNP